MDGLVGRDVLVADLQVECRASRIARQRNGNEDERSFAEDFGLIVLEPAQEPNCEEEDVYALFFLGDLRIAVDREQTLFQQFDFEICLQKRARGGEPWNARNFADPHLLRQGGRRVEGQEAHSAAGACQHLAKTVRVGVDDRQGAPPLGTAWRMH